ncbi:MAG: hypothetical protein KF901_29625 [Myxococcales bacterium]|nr:hypothetical protein [Myxococcales bacterium]
MTFRLAFAFTSTALLLVGCFRSRSNEPTPDGGTWCGPPPGEVCCTSEGPLDFLDGRCPFACPHGSWQTSSAACSFPRDGGVPRTDGGLDAGLCPAVRASFTCLESFVAPANERFELPVSFDECGCCAEATCGVDVDVRSRTLHLTTGLCPDPCDCDACHTPVARCAVPGLPRGDWRVEVNGAPAFVLPVSDADFFVPPPPACMRYAEDDGCDASDPISSGRPDPITEVCVDLDRASARGHVAWAVNDGCGGCAREGICGAVVMERLTDDLPPGGDIFLEPRRYFGACDGACPPACFETEQLCPLPTLDPGGFYRVYVHGALVFSFTEGQGRACGRVAP